MQSHPSLFVLIILSLLQLNFVLGDCGAFPTCLGCITEGPNCDWVPERWSCVPADSDNWNNVVKTHEDCSKTIKSYPPSPFRHQCHAGGMYSLTPIERFGAYCDCPNNMRGSGCQICTNSCPNSDAKCVQSLRNVPSGSKRDLSCECDSEFCKKINFGPGSGIVNIRLRFEEDENRAHLDLLRGVPLPNDDTSSLVSPYLLRANLTNCDSGLDLPCSQVCGTQKCPDGVPWTDEDTCRVWECHSPPSVLPETFTSCPPKDEPWGLYGEDCTFIRAVIKSPFQFACIVPKNENSPFVNGMVKCGFATSLLPQGNIALTCQIGTCVTEPVGTHSPTHSNSSDNGHRNSFASLFDCTGNYGDQQCWQTYYFLIILLPTVYTLNLVFFVMYRERKIRMNFNAAWLLRVHTDEETGDTGGTSDEFIQARLATRTNRRFQTPSPLISFHGISFGLQNRNSQQQHRLGNNRTPSTYRTILHSISGHVKPGELCAIIGPSGSGKTSLIDILAGRKNVGRISGNVSLDGHIASSNVLRQKVGYVTQDDVLPATSTVRECLLFHLSLRGNSTLPLLNRCERVEDILEELNLQVCANSYIGGGQNESKSISGGERRRVSIACELLGENNQLLVLDEPTSGLDSTSTQQVVASLLAVVTKEERTVILSIHQPSTNLFRKFNRVIVLSCTGRLLFCGPMESLEIFFAPIPHDCNPAEYLLDLCCESSDEVHRASEEKFESSPIRADQVSELRNLIDIQSSNTEVNSDVEKPLHLPKWKQQFVELSSRSIRNAWRHPVLAGTNVIATICVSISCGLLYRGVTSDLQGAINRAGLFFFFLCFLMLASLADLGVFQEERLMFMRERASGAYGSSAWFASKIFAEILPLRVVPLCLTAFILTFSVGLNEHPQAVITLNVLLLSISIVATLQFLSLGMIFTKPGVSNFSAVLLTMFSLLMSGFLLQFDGTGGGQGVSKIHHDDKVSSGFEWMQALSVLHFGFEALMVNEIHGLNFEIVVKSPDGGPDITRVGVSGDLILAQLGFSYGHFEYDFGIVITYCIIFSLFTLFLLEFIVVEHR